MAPAKRKRWRVTSGGKQGPSMARRGRCVGRSSARCKSRRGVGDAHRHEARGAETTCSTTVGALGRGDPPPSATGNRTPTPSEHARQGSPAGGSYKSWPQRKKAIQHCRRPTRILHRARGSVACTGLSQKMVSWPVVACPGGGQSPNPGSSGSKMSRTGRKTCSKRGRRADAQ